MEGEEEEEGEGGGGEGGGRREREGVGGGGGEGWVDLMQEPIQPPQQVELEVSSVFSHSQFLVYMWRYCNAYRYLHSLYCLSDSHS